MPKYIKLIICTLCKNLRNAELKFSCHARRVGEILIFHAYEDYDY